MGRAGGGSGGHSPGGGSHSFGSSSGGHYYHSSGGSGKAGGGSSHWSSSSGRNRWHDSPWAAAIRPEAGITVADQFTSGHEDDARKILEKKKEYENTLTGLTEAYDAAHANPEKMQKELGIS